MKSAVLNLRNDAYHLSSSAAVVVAVVGRTGRTNVALQSAKRRGVNLARCDVTFLVREPG